MSCKLIWRRRLTPKEGRRAWREEKEEPEKMAKKDVPKG